MRAHCGSIHPAYGFERHAGYGTEAHLSGIDAHGPLPGLHRMSFSPFKAA
jgi:ribonuclease HII